MNPVTVYLRDLRKGKGLRQEDSAKQAGVSIRQFNRWEKGGSNWLAADAMMRLYESLGADYEHLQALMQEGATIEQARSLARVALEASLNPVDLELDQAEIAEALKLVEGLRDNPQLLARWLGIGQGLAGAKNDSQPKELRSSLRLGARSRS